ncbi:MAG: type VI secretion system contractile sheath large subunit [Moraxellaceae bacterium]|nr:MAG: type VI secretion system contractile sheath large subunit [Moraxellaceae bacterium]
MTAQQPSTETPLLDSIEVAEKSRFDTDLDLFLREQNASRALTIWLKILSSNVFPESELSTTLTNDIADLDELINDQLNAILHAPKFQAMEARWRGLQLLTNESSKSKKIKVKLLDITWKEVVRDQEKALEFDQSQLFQKIYSEEFGTPGGEPYGLIVGDYEVCHKPSKNHPTDDMSAIKSLSQIGAAAFSPFILGAAPALFGVDHHADLNVTLNYDSIFKQDEYIKWRAYRETEDSRFLALTLPRILLRAPWRTKHSSFEGITFTEAAGDIDNKNYLWGNASFAFGLIILREFNATGWFSNIRGAPRNQKIGGLLTELPVINFESDAPNVVQKPVTNTIITDNLEKELGDHGFIPLCQCYDTPYASFHSNYSTQKPKKYSSPSATINAKLSAMLQHILCASRFAHYIKVMVRDKVGSFMSAQDCETYLERWLAEYVTGNGGLDWEMQARYPLRDATVRITERPDKPGCYHSVILLRPHYQLDQMVSELKLTTELASAAT